MSALQSRLTAGKTSAFSPDVLLPASDDAQATLPLASQDIQRWLWNSRYGAILIEVMGDDVFVNGQRVEPHAP